MPSPARHRTLDIARYVYTFDHRHDVPLPEVASLIGGKAANLSVMANELGLPVPPGFAISTEACRAYLEGGWPAGLDEETSEYVGHIERAIGRRFGGGTDPLLVSVRSGAPVSMPGMMDTILNLGLNDATADGLVAVSGDRAFVDGCRRRFSTAFRDIVGVSTIPDDPWLQLRSAIEAVFRSWNSDRARSYRAHEGISDDLGTGVIVQAMVFGNRSSDSATGVVFTRNPATGQTGLYGDIMFEAQGEDVVAGTHQPEPISELAHRMPAVAEELQGYANVLEHYYADVCDIEFTIEQGRLWLLQNRIGKRSPQAALRIAVEMAEDADFPLSRSQAVERVARHLVDPPTETVERGADARVVASGLGASPGVVSGAIATTPDGAVKMAESGEEVILIRRETSPDDVHGMVKAVGVLTTTGGLTSHAAVVARGWGIPAVVGAASVRVHGEEVTIGDRRFAVGDVVTIDGGSGEVFAGAVDTGTEILAEAATLLGWADELGIKITSPREEDPTEAGPAAVSAETGPPTSDVLLRALFVKGMATPDNLAEAFFTTPNEVASVLDRMAADGLAEVVGGMFQLTDDGKLVGNEKIMADRDLLGPKSASEALETFLPLDERMKEIVTAWQMREFQGQMVINDHTDAAHDAAVLGDFASLHSDAAPWVDSLSSGLPRLGRYGQRLRRAGDLVGEGDHKYIASPIVDSYHSVWFELHEDLILLAGRTRADEVAAGRA